MEHIFTIFIILIGENAVLDQKQDNMVLSH